MARTCTICQHPDREAIDNALLEGKLSNRRIAAQCAVTENALRRHVAAGHLPKHLAKAQEAGEVAKADTLLARLKALNAETRAILSEARAGQDNALALKAIARCEKQLELEARLLGELHEQTNVTQAENPRRGHKDEGDAKLEGDAKNPARTSGVAIPPKDDKPPLSPGYGACPKCGETREVWLFGSGWRGCRKCHQRWVCEG